MAPPPAFTDAEATAVRQWIENGGSLLFALNGFAAGPHSVLSRLGVEFKLGAATDTDIPTETDNNRSGGFMFSGELLSSAHRIFLGRSSAEQVRTVILSGMTAIQTMPQDAVTLIQCSGNAQFNPDFRQVQAAAKAKGLTVQQYMGRIPDPHAAVAIAYSLGKGRVVVLGNILISSTIFYSIENPRAGAYQGLRLGDNQQFTLNVLHWLSGLL